MNETAHDSALLQAILDAAADAIIISDSTGLIVRANPATSALFQYDLSDIIGKSVRALMPDDMAAKHDSYMTAYAQSGHKKIIGIGRDLEGKRKNGSIFPLHLSVGHARVEGEDLYVAILHDLTYRQATQDALARSQRLDAIGQMTGGIAHDFNNLLTVVTGNLELLEMRGARDDQHSLIKDALDAAELGAELTSRMMVFSRQSNLKPVETDLRELCTDTLAILRRTLGATYRIKTSFAADARPVMIDPVQLQSALMNLALNARDAMAGQGELLVSIENVTIDDTYMAQETDIASGEYVRLSVSDDGAGMSPDVQKRAFEPFFTSKAETGGTGLGLAMVYGFVRQSGGHITLYSELGHGSSFGLYFPALAGTSEHPGAVADPANSTSSPCGQGEVVLIVEDNPKVRTLSLERVRDLGFDAIAARNADEAYQMMQDGLQADILFSDLVMPGHLNGYDLADKIRQEFPHIKILLTSGYASDVVTSSMQHEEAFEILHKPYRQSDLAERLSTLLAEEPGE